MKNKVNLIGRIGSNPESKKLDSGKTVTRFSLATDDSWKDQKGEIQTDTQWHQVVMWGREGLIEKLQKGKEYHIEGKLMYDSYEIKKENGQPQKIKKAEIVLTDLDFIS